MPPADDAGNALLRGIHIDLLLMIAKRNATSRDDEIDATAQINRLRRPAVENRRPSRALADGTRRRRRQVELTGSRVKTGLDQIDLAITVDICCYDRMYPGAVILIGHGRVETPPGLLKDYHKKQLGVSFRTRMRRANLELWFRLCWLQVGLTNSMLKCHPRRLMLNSEKYFMELFSQKYGDFRHDV
jgi:hypothetical protein